MEKIDRAKIYVITKKCANLEQGVAHSRTNIFKSV